MGGLGSTRPQVRPDVRQESLRPLVRGRGYGGGRVLRGARGHGGPGEGLRRGRHGFPGGRGRGRRGVLISIVDNYVMSLFQRYYLFYLLNFITFSRFWTSYYFYISKLVMFIS